MTTEFKPIIIEETIEITEDGLTDVDPQILKDMNDRLQNK